jgi:hypothetical protein
VIGVDVARFGDDRTVIIKRQGLAAFDLQSWNGLSVMDVANQVMKVMNSWYPDAVFIDDIGVGGGVVDILRRYNYPVEGVNVATKALKMSRYSNKRAEVYDELKQWLESGGCIPDDLNLKQDIGCVPYEFDRNDRIKIWGKDKIKKELGRSPDMSDALALTFTHKVFARGGRGMFYRGGGANHVSETDYDVFSYHDKGAMVA